MYTKATGTITITTILIHMATIRTVLHHSLTMIWKDLTEMEITASTNPTLTSTYTQMVQIYGTTSRLTTLSSVKNPEQTGM